MVCNQQVELASGDTESLRFQLEWESQKGDLYVLGINSADHRFPLKDISQNNGVRGLYLVNDTLEVLVSGKENLPAVIETIGNPAGIVKYSGMSVGPIYLRLNQAIRKSQELGAPYIWKPLSD